MKTIFACLALLACSAILAPTSRAQSSPSPDLKGKWHFVLDTEGGDREVDAAFGVHDGDVTGKWNQNEDVHGKFASGKIDLAFDITSEEAGKGTLTLKGDLAGDTIKGNWTFQSYDGTFKATRVP